MAKEHVDSLMSLRDHLVEDRRNMVESILSDMTNASELTADFCGLQQVIDAVERAIAHEHSLDRPPAAWGSMPMGPDRSRADTERS
jgi:hypothetical protein